MSAGIQQGCTVSEFRSIRVTKNSLAPFRLALNNCRYILVKLLRYQTNLHSPFIENSRQYNECVNRLIKINAEAPQDARFAQCTG